MMRRQLVKAATATIAHPMLTVAIDRPTRLAGLVTDACDVNNPFAQIEGRFNAYPSSSQILELQTPFELPI